MGTSKNTLLFALAVLPLQASFITFNSAATDTSTAVGNYVNFYGVLALPQFDPALGTLTSVDFMLTVNGNLNWQIQSVAEPTISLYVTTNTQFLGANLTSQNDMLTGEYYCGTAFNPAPCSSIQSGFRDWSDCPIQMSGGIVGSTLATRNRLFCFALAPVSSLLDMNLFIGSGTAALPISTVVFAGKDYGAWAGAISGEQRVNWNSTWTYNYSEPPVVEAHAPEPGTTMIMIFAMIALIARPGRRKT